MLSLSVLQNCGNPISVKLQNISKFSYSISIFKLSTSIFKNSGYISIISLGISVLQHNIFKKLYANFVPKFKKVFRKLEIELFYYNLFIFVILYIFNNILDHYGQSVELYN